MLTDVHIDEFNEHRYFLQSGDAVVATQKVSSVNLVETCCIGVWGAVGCCCGGLWNCVTFQWFEW